WLWCLGLRLIYWRRFFWFWIGPGLPLWYTRNHFLQLLHPCSIGLWIRLQLATLEWRFPFPLLSKLQFRFIFENIRAIRPQLFLNHRSLQLIAANAFSAARCSSVVRESCAKILS